MTEHAELERVVGRYAAMRLVGDHAEHARCRVAGFGADGRPLVAEGRLAGARPSGVNGSIRVDGVDGPTAVAAVIAFERLVGYVVVAGNEDNRRAGAPREVAEHSAAVLGELCAREYELDDLSREILGSYEELNVFYDLAGELAGARDADAIFRVVLAKARHVIAAKEAWILVADGTAGVLRVAAADDPSLVGRPVQIDASQAGAAFTSRAAASVDDVRQSDPAKLSELERRADRSLVSVPLCVPGNSRASVGVLQLRDKHGAAAFTSGDLKLAQAIGSQAAVLVQNSKLMALERELNIARTIQESLLPGEPPKLPGLEVAGACAAASNVGGDYYDHMYVGASSIAFLVADVSGHNIASALMQTAARAALRAIAPRGSSPGEVLRRASIALHEDLSHAELFITVWLGRVDSETGTLYYSDAGHNPAILYRARTGETSRLCTGGVPIGVLDDATFDAGEIVLEPGDVVVAYTDGFTEASAPDNDDVMYGEERFAATVAKFAHLPAREIVAALQEDVARFCGDRPASDDRTLVVMRRVPA